MKMEYEIEVHEIFHVRDTVLKRRLHVIMPFSYFSRRFVCVALVVSRWEQGHYDSNEQHKKPQCTALGISAMGKAFRNA